jgi:HAD superfamily, subfamily IIIB (Acid phosphatase)
MFAVRIAPGLRQKNRQRFAAGLKRTVAIALGAVALAGAPAITAAKDCPAETQVRVPQTPAPPLNIDKVKEVLLAYQAGPYDGDVAAVFTTARTYVEGRASQVSKPALVLDIDETSLSNWANIKANNFGFIREGACDLLPHGPCGFKAWILQAVAPVIMPALDLFNAAKAKGVSVFFITGRRDSERQATLWNLDRAGFEGWAKLVTRPDDDSHATVQAFKTEERRKIAEAGYTIIATVGDQQSDLDGGFAECKFKVPNPFYFIP